MFGAGHIHGRSYNMFMSAKLDRLVVGSILKQEIRGLSKSVSDRCEREFVLGLHRPLHILSPGFAENPDDEWAMDGH